MIKRLEKIFDEGIILPKKDNKIQNKKKEEVTFEEQKKRDIIFEEQKKRDIIFEANKKERVIFEEQKQREIIFEKKKSDNSDEDIIPDEINDNDIMDTSKRNNNDEKKMSKLWEKILKKHDEYRRNHESDNLKLNSALCNIAQSNAEVYSETDIENMYKIPPKLYNDDIVGENIAIIDQCDILNFEDIVNKWYEKKKIMNLILINKVIPEYHRMVL